jgi:hypothetical protein
LIDFTEQKFGVRSFDDGLLTYCGFKCRIFGFVVKSHLRQILFDALWSLASIHDTILRCDLLFISSKQHELWMIKGNIFGRNQHFLASQTFKLYDK